MCEYFLFVLCCVVCSMFEEIFEKGVSVVDGE